MPNFRPFDQAWQREDTRQYIALLATMGKATQEGASLDKNEPYSNFDQIEDKLIRAVGEHLGYLSQEGKLSMPPNSEGVMVPWVEAWTKLLEDPENLDVQRDIGEFFRKRAFMRLWSKEGEVKSDDEISALHDQVVKDYMEGNFGHYDTSLGECRLTGDAIRLQMQSWQPTLGLTVAPDEGFRMRFEPLGADRPKAPVIEHVEINVPSGRLLISDWFRIPEFTHMTDALLKENEADDMSSVMGTARYTKTYAKIGLVSVMVGNCSPEIVVNDNKVIVGWREAEDQGAKPKSGTLVGRIDTRIRWASMIDMQVLVDYLGQEMGQEKAEEAVAALLLNRDEVLCEVKIPPGTYHLYFAGRPQVFVDQFKTRDMDTSMFPDPLVVLSDVPLALEAAPSPKRKSPSP